MPKSKHKLLNIIGQTFDALTVLREVESIYRHIPREGRTKNIHRERRWECLCECGQIIVTNLSNLRRKPFHSCGCQSTRGQASITHGKSLTPEHITWKSIKARCYNPSNKRFNRYGGRGIIVCDRWKNSFENFLEDMGVRPTLQHSIERIDNNGHYCPENCKWATDEEQNNNRSNNHFLTFNNKTQTLNQWIRETNLKEGTIRGRLRNHWCTPCILTIPVHKGRCVHR